MDYTFPIQIAFSCFPLVAIFIALPYALYHYHKYGSISFFRTIIIYSFILYLINVYFLVILPLPSFDVVMQLTTPYVQLIPFHFIMDIMENVNIISADWGSVVVLFQSQEFLQVLYNIIMTIPFGIYSRYYFKCSFSKTLFFSFLMSLFFELTQLSGLYFIYPRPYRLFDVDDLMLNTFGGLLGYFIAFLVMRLFPSRDQIDQISYEKGKDVTFFRRFLAFLLDWFCIIGIILLFEIFFFIVGIQHNIVVKMVPFFYFIICSYFTAGQTLGQKFLNLRLVNYYFNDNNDNTPKLWQYCIRYLFLYGILLPGPIYIYQLFHLFYNAQIWWCLLIILFMIGIYIKFLLELIAGIFQKNSIFIYDKIGKTKIISTIDVK